MSTIRVKNFIKKYLIFNPIGLSITKFNDYVSNDLKIIKKNKKYEGIHRGKRCFILGNGPSINQEDLSKLENEIVFVVNQVAKADFYKIIKPKYYFCVDSTFFNLDANDIYDMQTIQAFKDLKNEKCNPTCFIPAKFKGDVKRYGIENLEISYFIDSYRMTDNWRQYIDYSKVVPSFCTVVQYAITMAVYMGFNEIYLLGCDNTGIIATINSTMQKDNNAVYSYNVSEAENKRMERMVARNGLENYCESYLYTLQDYRKLYSYCLKRKTNLVNCSSNTVIDSIPRKRLVDVL